MKRQGYKRLFIERLEQVYGLSTESAEKNFSRLYRQGLKLYGKDRPFITTREMYYSMLGMGKSQAFKFDADTLQLDKDYKLDKGEKLRNDLDALISHDKRRGIYGKVEGLISKYEDGDLTYKELLNELEEYKNSVEYKAIQREYASSSMRRKRRKVASDLDINLSVKRRRKRK